MAENCARCGKSSEEFQGLDAGLIVKLKEAGKGDSFPDKVCGSCFAELAGSVARGSVLLAREKAKEQKKLVLWKSRVNLIKKARQYMNDKMFSDAAVAYEKYIKVLEVVFDVKSGELNAEHFKDSARTQELTVVASVYWDLLRIYDTSSRYGDRQRNAANKLAQFLRFTPIYPDILRKAEAFEKSAKNPAVVKSFLKSASDSKGRCFIASAAFNTPYVDEIRFLQDFRDQKLLNTASGKGFVYLYYKFSPFYAALLDKYPLLKRPTRRFLSSLVNLARRQSSK